MECLYIVDTDQEQECLYIGDTDQEQAGKANVGVPANKESGGTTTLTKPVIACLTSASVCGKQTTVLHQLVTVDLARGKARASLTSAVTSTSRRRRSSTSSSRSSTSGREGRTIYLARIRAGPHFIPSSSSILYTVRETTTSSSQTAMATREPSWTKLFLMEPVDDGIAMNRMPSNHHAYDHADHAHVYVIDDGKSDQ